MNFTNRRWLRFSLRSLFVMVTIVALWLGWELRYIQQRRTALVQTPAFKFGGNEKGIGVSSSPSVSIPFWRTWLGDEAVSQLVLNSKAGEVEIDKIVSLFPEAQVMQGKPVSIEVETTVGRFPEARFSQRKSVRNEWRVVPVVPRK